MKFSSILIGVGLIVIVALGFGIWSGKLNLNFSRNKSDKNDILEQAIADIRQRLPDKYKQSQIIPKEKDGVYVFQLFDNQGELLADVEYSNPPLSASNNNNDDPVVDSQPVDETPEKTHPADFTLLANLP